MGRIRRPGYSEHVILESCKHASVQPAFDEDAARDLSSYEVRERWPRFSGVCPECGSRVILYASCLHYISGDW